MLDSSCLANDFFTNASSGITPRLPYIFVLGEITRAIGNGVGGGLSVVKALLLAFIPAVMTFVIVASISSHTITNNEDVAKHGPFPATIFAAIGSPILIILMQGEVGAGLSVAWWVPLYFEGTPHNFSLLLTLIGFSLICVGASFIGAMIVFIGGIFHPAVGLFTSVFSLVLFCKLNSIRQDIGFLIIGFIASLLAAIIVKLFLESSSSLSAQEFVRIYVVEAHPSHYLPSQFGSLSKIPWYGSFSIVGGGLAWATYALYKLDNAAWKNSFIALVSYLGAVVFQYLFVELYPIKIIAALGPSRFTMFGPWFLFIFSFIAIYTSFNTNMFLISFARTLNLAIPFVCWRHVGFGGFLVATLVVIYSNKSASIELPDDDSKELADFAIANTGKGDIFALPFSAPRVDFSLKTGRGVFHGNGFPFSESYFNEWDARHTIIDGSNAEIRKHPGAWIGEKYANHYRSLTPADFINAASRYELDWVVVENEFSRKFVNCRADFESLKYEAYSLSALKLCALSTQSPQ